MDEISVPNFVFKHINWENVIFNASGGEYYNNNGVYDEDAVNWVIKNHPEVIGPILNRSWIMKMPDTVLYDLIMARGKKSTKIINNLIYVKKHKLASRLIIDGVKVDKYTIIEKIIGYYTRFDIVDIRLYQKLMKNLKTERAWRGTTCMQLHQCIKNGMSGLVSSRKKEDYTRDPQIILCLLLGDKKLFDYEIKHLHTHLRSSILQDPRVDWVEVSKINSISISLFEFMKKASKRETIENDDLNNIFREMMDEHTLMSIHKM